MYPTLGGNAAMAPGGAESFYTGNAQPHLAQGPAYGQYGAQVAYGQPPSQQYAGYDRNPTAASPYPSLDQRQEQQQSYQYQQPDQRAMNAPSPYPQQAQHTGYGPSAPPPNFNPSEPASTPSADPNAAYYYGNGPQAQTQSQPQPQLQSPQHTGQQGLSDPNQNYYANQQSQPQNPHANLQSPHPDEYAVSPLPQHAQPDGNACQSQRPPSQQQTPQAQSSEQTYRQPTAQAPQKAQPHGGYQVWQQQQHNQSYDTPQSTWVQPAAPQPAFNQQAFPTAPQHNPGPKQPVAVEEPLIEF